MTSRSWPVLVVGLTALLLLLFLPGVALVESSERAYEEVRRIRESYEYRARGLERIQDSLLTVSILMRDFLLDSAPSANEVYAARYRAEKQRVQAGLSALRSSMRPEDSGPLERLTLELESYWASLEPVLAWAPDQRKEGGTYFLRQQQRPRRQGLLAITTEIARLNESNYERQLEQMNRSREEVKSHLRRVVALTFLLGLGVALVTGWRINRLEKRSREQQLATERAEGELRRLSTQLRHAQEDERRHLSRELHDEIGQMLTGLRLELGTLARLREEPGSRFEEHVSDAKALAEGALRAVRDIAVGLRPSTLDDLGLAPAIEWLAREFTRRTGVAVHVEIDPESDTLPEEYRTCLYRVAQEALTNCARHAQASRVAVGLRRKQESWELSVDDDGAGCLLQGAEHRGLGLVGMEERLKELGGSLRVQTSPGEGWRLAATLPLAKPGVVAA